MPKKVNLTVELTPAKWGVARFNDSKWGVDTANVSGVVLARVGSELK